MDCERWWREDGRVVGLESGFQDAIGIALQIVFLAFIVGPLVVARRARGPGTVAST